MEGLVVCGACFQFLHTVDVFVIVLVLWNAVIGFCVVKCYWFGGVCVFSFRVVCLSGLAIVLRICICMYIHTYICVCVKNGCNHTQVNVCMYRALYVCGVYIIVSSTLLCVYV